MPKNWTLKQKQKLVGWLAPHEITSLANEHGTPLQIVSRQRLKDQYEALKRELPMVDHHFAIKAFPSPEGLKILADAGMSFDVASTGEIDLALQAGVSSKKMVHTHPIKRPQDVKDAIERGIDTFVYDSLYELEVFEPYKDKVRLLLRVSFRTKDAQIDLSYKFGAPVENTVELLQQTVDAGYRVDGLSFHAGSQLYSPAPMVEAITACKKLFDSAKKLGITLSVLDIGGGWPAPYTKPIPEKSEFCAPVRKALEEHFPERVKIVSEVGRGVCAEAVVSVMSVMGMAEREGELWYYLDDGIYGSYSGILFEHGEYHIWSLKELEQPELELAPSTLAGPTCDSVDVFARSLPLPKLDRGDILVSPSMGAYSWATSNSFNAFPVPKLVFID
jgi:ornithine decarboxylase